MKIGVLALQGDFALHAATVESLGHSARFVRAPEELADVDGLIIPGGESTTLLTIIREEQLWGPLDQFAAAKPVFGTCAGAILMARDVSGPAQESFGWIDIAVERNAYGRQVDSAIRYLDPDPAFVERTEPGKLRAVYIRAPIIRTVGPDTTALLHDGDLPILVEEGRHLAATFHPEESGDSRVHQLFLRKVQEASEAK